MKTGSGGSHEVLEAGFVPGWTMRSAFRWAVDVYLTGIRFGYRGLAGTRALHGRNGPVFSERVDRNGI